MITNSSLLIGPTVSSKIKLQLIQVMGSLLQVLSRIHFQEVRFLQLKIMGNLDMAKDTSNHLLKTLGNNLAMGKGTNNHKPNYNATAQLATRCNGSTKSQHLTCKTVTTK